MLIKRILTAIVLIAIVIGVIFTAPIEIFALLAAGFMLLAAWEWSQLAGINCRKWRIVYVVTVAIVFYLFVWLWQQLPSMSLWLFILLPLTWIGCWLWIKRYPSIPQFTVYGLSLLGYWLLSGCWLSLVLIQQIDPRWLLLLLVLVWAADTGAYFAGRAFGRRHLMPAVSPNKTIEGLFGGMALTIIVALTGLLWLPVDVKYSIELVLIAVLVGFFALIGDLWVSVLKRQRGVKDSGNLLPGHGGILDRIDSLLAAAPVFAGLFLFFFSGFLNVSLV